MADSRKTVNCRVGFSPPIPTKFSILNSKFLLLLCTFALVLFNIAAPAQGKYGGGTGDPNDPYLIYKADQMNEIGLNEDDWDKCFKLCADIDLSGYTGAAFNIIGYYEDLWPLVSIPFRGVFDGNGHTISNFTYTSQDTSSVGLFGYVNGENAEIKDLGLIDPNVEAKLPMFFQSYRIGSLVGHFGDGTITDCYVEGGSVSGGDYVGGLVGSVGSREEYNDAGTMTNCHANCSVLGVQWVGGLVGCNYGTISNCYSEGSVSGDNSVGGLVGLNDVYEICLWPPTQPCLSLIGEISNCYSTGSVSGNENVGGLVGSNEGFCVYPWPGPQPPWCLHAKISNCYSTGSVSGISEPWPWPTMSTSIGGLVGSNSGTIINCESSGDVEGGLDVGGLVGHNRGTITNCSAMGGVSNVGGSGGPFGPFGGVGGLVGWNDIFGTITNCYATGSVSGNRCVGGLVGTNDHYGTITNCYSIGGVSGEEYVGGLVGLRVIGWPPTELPVLTSFWDVNTSGQTTSDGGTGLPTAEMQLQITFTDAGWDFITPVWTIDEGVDYPRLWREFVPILHVEPEITLGTSNTITWEPIADNILYDAECAEDANFTSILYNTHWMYETGYEFRGLLVGQRYWYRVKAINAEFVESKWSNVESSLQGTLADAVEKILEPESLKNDNAKNALLNKIDAALKMIDQANYTGALSKLEQDILQKTDGCADAGEPDKNDWILTCEQQSEIYPLIIETIEHVKGLMGE